MVGFKKGVDLPGAHRDPMDFGAMAREQGLKKKDREKIVNVGLRAPIDVATLAGFTWKYLIKNFDRPVMTEIAPGVMGFSPFHVDFWGLMCDLALLVAAAAPRAHAKSTIGTLAWGLASILFRSEDYLVIVSDTYEGQAVEHVREYQRELRENEELIKDFRIKKLLKDTEGDIILQFDDGGVARIKALGMEGPVRGLKWRNKRPGTFLIDDAENTELVESKTRRDKSRGWIMKDLIPAGRKGCKVRMIGTILHHDATLARFCRASSWKSKIYKAHRAFDDFRDILWPEMWPAERLKAERQRYMDQNDSDGYSQEYLNDPIAPTDAYFNVDNLVAGEEGDIEGPGENYCGWDFAVSKEQTADWCVLSTWKVDEHLKKSYTYAERGRWGADGIIDKIFWAEEEFHPRAHFVETGVIDKAIGPFLDAEMDARGIYPTIIKITRTKDKITFAKPLQGIVKRQALLCNKNMELWPIVEEEFRKFPKGEWDDIVDSNAIIAQGLRDLTRAPSEEERKEDEYFDKFLRPIDEGLFSGGRNPTTGY